MAKANSIKNWVKEKAEGKVADLNYYLNGIQKLMKDAASFATNFQLTLSLINSVAFVLKEIKLMAVFSCCECMKVGDQWALRKTEITKQTHISYEPGEGNLS